ncbi:hypothetical protein KRP22_006271 [Phytophthora ramorum]|nr:hypothetical protein KRP22_2597 [Phytophthora ramorum]
MNTKQGTPPKTSSEITVAFGNLCFKPLSSRFPKSTISWTELQKLELYEDFEVWWSNVCVRTSSTLLNALEVEMEKGVPQSSTILVTLADKKRKECELDYHLVDGRWELQSGHAKRVVRSTLDVFVDNDTSLRVRGFTCEAFSGDVLNNLERHVSLSTPATNNFFDTKVALRRSAPYGLALRWAVPKLKFHLELKGVQFTVSYVDQRRKEFRLECRLPAVDEGQSDERQELLKRVLQLLHD